MTTKSCANRENLSVIRHMTIRCQVEMATFRKVKRVRHTTSRRLWSL